MSMRLTPFVSQEYYHLYNRGNSKQVIFHDDQDHHYFMDLLKIMNNAKRTKTDFSPHVDDNDKVVSIGAFCLMPNHFHILIKQEKDGGISLFMQKLSTAYAMYYNKKYKRTGGLFEGRFKSKYAGEDSYLKYIFSYIHLNPLKIIDQNWKTAKMQKDYLAFLSQYRYSSFNEYTTGKYECINKKAFPDYFPTRDSFLKETTYWFGEGSKHYS